MSENFKTGRYSGYLPQVLRERYEAAREDPERLALSEEIALLDARLQEVVSTLVSEQPAGLWQKFKDQVDEVCLYARRREYGDMLQGLLNLQAMVREGVREQVVWREVMDLVERRRVLVESERRRMVDLRQYLTAEKAVLLVQAVGGVVLAHVKDPKVQQAIAKDLEGLLTKSGGREVVPVPMPGEAEKAAARGVPLPGPGWTPQGEVVSGEIVAGPGVEGEGAG